MSVDERIRNQVTPIYIVKSQLNQVEKLCELQHIYCYWSMIFKLLQERNNREMKISTLFEAKDLTLFSAEIRVAPAYPTPIKRR